ncbi:hypothetical protein J5N97_029709 [Dioscorea zingiberensis]|uniref:Ubiquinol-cytochrome c chaperone domain-containing protein n=1 Tax=Dioscorea zingiberensis TaxID=325984 RepID=A0A9D5BW77_9LILI|nr:hypothetical protein J5N97_029709 [Dioscorea zingiberensis]
MVVSLSSFSRIEGTTPKIGPRILARAKSSSDEGKSSVSIVDGNMGMLKERMAMIKLRERLHRGSRGSHGWNYMKSYESCESEIKRDVKFKEFVEIKCYKFWSKPTSLALAPNSPLRIEEPKFEGFRYIMLKLLLFYSKQSKSIRGANVVYRRITSQVDKPAIYDVFHLEKTFKTTYALLVLHMWLFLRRLREEGKEGSEFGQYLYEIYNHDLELRVSKAGVNFAFDKMDEGIEEDILPGGILLHTMLL